MPELAAELRIMEESRRAQVAAQGIGPLRQPLDPLTDSQLEAPLERLLDESDEPKAPPLLRGYLNLEEIGSGSQGTVFKGVQESTGRQVAVKVFAGGGLASSRARNRLNREADILASLDHANIVGILDRGRTSDGTFYLVMPFISGLPLDEYAAELVQKDYRALEKILKLFVRAAGALHAAHAQNIVHRDLKPSNLLVDEWGEPHVLDFGLAKFMDGLQNERQTLLTMTGQVVGSLAWASPEQTASGSEVDARSDVYALGVMLYQTLTGRFPYEVSGPIALVIRRIQTIIPDAPSAGNQATGLSHLGRIAPGLDAIVLKALAKSPEARYASAAELATDLENYLGGRPTMASAQRRPARRFHWPYLCAGLVVASALGIGVWRQWGMDRHSGQIPAQVFELPIETNTVGMKLVRISPGSFRMGSPLAEKGRRDDEQAHQVTLNQPYWIAVTDVTCGQYRAVMGHDSPGGSTASDDFPVTNVSWYDAMEFCQKLGARENQVYRLPTEAEWEYACRAGKRGAFPVSGKLGDYSWYADNSEGRLHAVATKLPNSWGLYDMQGNADQWCADVFSFGYRDSSAENLHVGESEDLGLRVIRGGNFSADAIGCRSAQRDGLGPTVRQLWLSFRVVRNELDAMNATSHPH
jgi:formylglycine-generating enzyme required for sulfatase activity/tRNA A-37 threonylcarbamoyl transferase component Bud32